MHRLQYNSHAVYIYFKYFERLLEYFGFLFSSIAWSLLLVFVRSGTSRIAISLLDRSMVSCRKYHSYRIIRSLAIVAAWKVNRARKVASVSRKVSFFNGLREIIPPLSSHVSRCLLVELPRKWSRTDPVNIYRHFDWFSAMVLWFF